MLNIKQFAETEFFEVVTKFGSILLLDGVVMFFVLLFASNFLLRIMMFLILALDSNLFLKVVSTFIPFL